ncbi:DJ-1/PfpI family protein [Rothia aerolata]|uniref:Thiazole biosynthesis protein ThiJ n=1 Tax=Rothia aerolata TaxID=1812262 RepID=A0A917IMW7_9MICC|nr:DJ-1/PfpI family protein [Rothia aerolata]GGH59243.1 thiazole biosynthesis protein ThiJ [Rothia aerolata]
MKISVILFEGFELLDVFGPVELLSFVEGWEIEYLALVPGPVRSSQSARVVAEKSLAEVEETDMLLVPGGRGTRGLVEDDAFLTRLRQLGENARWVASVCTGSALLAAAGLLEGHRATSNKRAFNWATSFGSDVTWLSRARWVHSGNRWTSSGISAGIDMAAAFIRHLRGEGEAERICQIAEITVRTDSLDDPFAVDTRASSPASAMSSS